MMKTNGKATKGMNEPEDFDRRFKHAADARSAGEFDRAEEIFRALLSHERARKTKTRAILLVQLGFVLFEAGKLDDSEEHYREAIRLSPRSELSSLGLYHAFFAQGRLERALQEVLRFVTLRDSPEYRELLNDGFCNELADDLRPIAEEARSRLAEHAPARGDPY